LHLYLWPFTR